MKPRLTACLGLCLLLSACAGADSRDVNRTADFQPDDRPLGKTLVYECDGAEFIARVGPGEMALWFDDRYLVLSQVRSGSGAKYQEGSVLFWSKGDEAQVEVDGQRYSGCRLNHARAPWEDARRRGVDFRAVGNEPGWHLEISDGQHLLWVGDYGSTRILHNDPRSEQEAGLRRYRAGEGGQAIEVTVTDRFCVDTMKGEEFPFTVAVQLAGRRYQGCGRELEHPWE